MSFSSLLTGALGPTLTLNQLSCLVTAGIRFVNDCLDHDHAGRVDDRWHPNLKTVQLDVEVGPVRARPQNLWTARMHRGVGQQTDQFRAGEVRMQCVPHSLDQALDGVRTHADGDKATVRQE
jgi:hypothetical protein